MENSAPKKLKRYRRQIRVAGRMLERTFSFKKDADDWYAHMRRKKELIESGLDIGFEAIHFQTWAGQWLADRAPKLEPPTLRQYNQFLMRDCLPEFGTRHLHLISSRDIEKFLYRIKSQRQFSNSTFNRYRTLLKTIFGDAIMVRPRHLIDNPVTQVKKLIENPRQVQIFERTEEMERYILGAWEQIHPPFWIAVMIFLNTGVRLGEALAIQRKDVLFLENTILVTKARDYATSEVRPYPKGKRHRSVPANDTLLNALAFWFEFDSTGGPDDYIVRWVRTGAPERGRWKDDGRPFSSSHIHYLHDKLCTKLGLRKGITLHSLRHTYATHELAKVPDIYRLMKILGHQEISTTERYLHLVEERLKKKEGFSVGVSIQNKLGLVKG